MVVLPLHFETFFASKDDNFGAKISEDCENYCCRVSAWFQNWKIPYLVIFDAFYSPYDGLLFQR